MILRTLVTVLFLFLAMGIYFIIFSPTLANEEKVINIRHSYVKVVDQVVKRLDLPEMYNYDYLRNPIRVLSKRGEEKYWYGFHGKLEKLDFDRQTMSYLGGDGKIYTFRITYRDSPSGIIHPMRKGLLLYNPAAGRYPVRRFVRGIIHPLKDAGWSMEIAETLSGTHATQTAHQAAVEKYDAVFAIGGDGTVGQVASGLLDSETALGVLPAGTTNVWAIEQGQKPFSWFNWWSLRDNAKLIANVEPQRVDVGMCNDRPFLLWAGVGLDAQTINKIEPRHRFFKHISVPHFFATTVWEATFWHGLDLRVWADGQLVEGHYLVAVANNIRHYAGGMSVLSPEALLDDNEMDMWLLSGNNVADALRHFFDLIAGRHLTSDQARRLPFHTARVESDAAFSIQVDGDPALGGHHADITIKHRALRILMPTDAYFLLKNKK